MAASRSGDGDDLHWDGDGDDGGDGGESKRRVGAATAMAAVQGLGLGAATERSDLAM